MKNPPFKIIINTNHTPKAHKTQPEWCTHVRVQSAPPPTMKRSKPMSERFGQVERKIFLSAAASPRVFPAKGETSLYHSRGAMYFSLLPDVLDTLPAGAYGVRFSFRVCVCSTSDLYRCTLQHQEPLEHSKNRCALRLFSVLQ